MEKLGMVALFLAPAILGIGIMIWYAHQPEN